MDTIMNVDPYQILSYGVIGLGFLLAFLAYRLLTREQQRDEPRPSMVRAIYTFMAFSLFLCVIGFGSEFSKSNANLEFLEEQAKSAEKLGQENQRFREELASIKASMTSLLDVKLGVLAAIPRNHPETKAIAESLEKIDSSLQKLLGESE